VNEDDRTPENVPRPDRISARGQTLEVLVGTLSFDLPFGDSGKDQPVGRFICAVVVVGVDTDVTVPGSLIVPPEVQESGKAKTRRELPATEAVTELAWASVAAGRTTDAMRGENKIRLLGNSESGAIDASAVPHHDHIETRDDQ